MMTKRRTDAYLGLAKTTSTQVLAQLFLADDSPEWAVVVCDNPQAAAQELHETALLSGMQILSLDVAPGFSASLLFPPDGPTQAITIMQGLDETPEEQLGYLDFYRDHLRTAYPRTIVLIPGSAADRIRAAAPHWSDYSLPDWKRLVPDEYDAVSVDEELAYLSEKWTKSNEEVITLAERGELPDGSDFRLWLVLLGRGDLLPAPFGSPND